MYSGKKSRGKQGRGVEYGRRGGSQSGFHPVEPGTLSYLTFEFAKKTEDFGHESLQGGTVRADRGYPFAEGEGRVVGGVAEDEAGVTPLNQKD